MKSENLIANKMSNTIRRLSLIVPLLSLTYLSVKAQDKIILENGTTIEGKVIEIGSEELKYKKAISPDGPVYSIKKSTLKQIEYQNGRIEPFGQALKLKQEILRKHTLAVTGGKVVSSIAFKDSIRQTLNYPASSLPPTTNIMHREKYIKYQKGFYEKHTKFNLIDAKGNEQEQNAYNYITIQSNGKAISVSKIGLQFNKSSYTVPQDSYSPYKYSSWAFLCLLYADDDNITYLGKGKEGNSAVEKFRVDINDGTPPNTTVHWLNLDAGTLLPVSCKIKNSGMEADVVLLNSKIIDDIWTATHYKATNTFSTGSTTFTSINDTYLYDIQINTEQDSLFQEPDMNSFNAIADREKQKIIKEIKEAIRTLSLSTLEEIKLGASPEEVKTFLKNHNLANPYLYTENAIYTKTKNTIAHLNQEGFYRQYKQTPDISFLSIGTEQGHYLYIDSLNIAGPAQLYFGFDKEVLKSIILRFDNLDLPNYETIKLSGQEYRMSLVTLAMSIAKVNAWYDIQKFKPTEWAKKNKDKSDIKYTFSGLPKKSPPYTFIYDHFNRKVPNDSYSGLIIGDPEFWNRYLWLRKN